MKKAIAIVVICLSFISCQDTIEVDVPQEQPRLMIDALIRVHEADSTINFTIKTGLTSGFFDSIKYTSVANVLLINHTLLDTLKLVENPDTTGFYQPEIPTELNFLKTGNLSLVVTYQEQTYYATTNYAPTVPIDTLTQGDGTLFGEDDTEVIVTFTDEPNREDYYIFDFDYGNYEITEDTYYPGNQVAFSYFYDENLSTGAQPQISILGADKAFYTYMSQLIELSRSEYNPFATPTSTVKGNIFDLRNVDNPTPDPSLFPLGYFAVVQTYHSSITIE